MAKKKAKAMIEGEHKHMMPGGMMMKDSEMEGMMGKGMPPKGMPPKKMPPKKMPPKGMGPKMAYGKKGKK